MLSIRLDAEREWWVSGAVWDRLFDSALTSGVMAREMDQWRNVVHANGGIDLELLEPHESRVLVAVLRAAAKHDVAQPAESRPETNDDAYWSSLRKLLALTG